MNIDRTSECRDLLELRDELARSSAPAWRPVAAAIGRVRTIRRDEAERELARVHVAEVARLLREAVMLRCAASGPSVSAIFLPAPDRTSIVARSLEDRAAWRTRAELARWRARTHAELARWRARARAELAQWRVDGVESPAVLRACVVRPVHQWDDARSLARAAFALVPCDAARLCLACAELARGHARGAAEVVEVLLARDLEPQVRRAAVRVLAEVDRRRAARRGEG